MHAVWNSTSSDKQVRARMIGAHASSAVPAAQQGWHPERRQPCHPAASSAKVPTRGQNQAVQCAKEVPAALLADQLTLHPQVIAHGNYRDFAVKCFSQPSIVRALQSFIHMALRFAAMLYPSLAPAAPLLSSPHQSSETLPAVASLAACLAMASGSAASPLLQVRALRGSPAAARRAAFSTKKGRLTAWK